MMAIWRHTLKLADFFQDDSLSTQEKQAKIVERIKGSTFWDAENLDLADMVDAMEHAETVEAFDFYWEEFYGWADDERVWVEVF